MKRTLSIFLALSLSAALPVSVSASSPLNWYESQEEGTEKKAETSRKEEKSEKKKEKKKQKETSNEYQAKIHMTEEKIVSPTFGCAVGRTMIPDGWTMNVQDLTLSSESACCPNAVFMTATSPDGNASMTFISRREYCQKYNNAGGYEFYSGDDEYDYSSLMHNLNYRNADASCDLMQSILFGEASFIKDRGLTDEEAELVSEADEGYYEMIANTLSSVPNIGQLTDTEFTAARKSYSDGQNDYTLFCSSCGYQIEKVSYGYQSDTIMWAMPFVYALKTDSASHEDYQEAFDVFCSSTAVSDEYEKMREQNAMQIITEMSKAQSGGYTYTPDYDSNFSDTTIESGETYSALAGWDDVIKEQNDYTTGSGEHVKVPTYFDHVYEGSDSSIYASNSFDAPYDSTELSPTQIGK